MGRLIFANVELPLPVEDGIQTSPHWIVTVYNNDTNSFDQVITILVLATGCKLAEAEMEAWEIHHLGRSVVHHGTEADCAEVAQVVGTIGIRVEVSEE